MKKHITIFMIAVICFCSIFTVQAQAADFTVNNVGYYVYTFRGSTYASTVWYNLVSVADNKFKYFITVNPSGQPYGSLEAAQSACMSLISDRYSEIMGSTQGAPFDNGQDLYSPSFIGSGSQVVYIYNLPKLSASIDPVEPTSEPTPTPTPGPEWYEEMWDALKEELGDPAFWFGEWFIDLIDNVYGNDEEEDPTGPPKPPNSTHVKINNPTPAPTPTPIPYSTVIVPKTDIISGDTVYETNYYYVNPSGTPIVATAPPTQPPASGGNGNGTDYTPVGGDPYAIPQVSWLTNGVLTDDNNNTMDGISSIADGMDSIDAIGTDYTDGMGVVQDATGTLPTSWLLLIGIAAAIPLIAGIISRFLS